MKRQRGILLIEVLVSMLIASVALLGTVMMMARSTRNEMESYQRVQALTLVQDMVSRLNANRQVAACYSNGATGLATGSGYAAPPTCATGTPSPTALQAATANADLAAWRNALLGAGESSGGNKVGAMLGAIGCVERIDATNNVYRITVVWQGLMPTAAPGVTCGQNKFGDDSLRRAVSVQVRIASLS
ncbi:type IV pilus modification protein PilV [Dyella marensis]|uniref:type IV pilus modification protein PilV n=1 Tax=Dyella TaxID=231454 RepID=UPI0014466A79|nr:type IV pilus modification protein PilV [Dyella sp. SG609]NKJ23592.1 type IV pilus assembly protein PilV [Dyella sp. SG609]